MEQRNTEKAHVMTVAVIKSMLIEINHHVMPEGGAFNVWEEILVESGLCLSRAHYQTPAWWNYRGIH